MTFGPEQVFGCTGRPQLKIDVNVGLLFVRGWDGNEIRVEDGANARIRQKGNTIIIDSTRRCELKIYLPRSSDIFIDGTNLETDLGGIRGAGSIDITNGPIAIEDWQGDLEIDGTGAAIRISQSEGQFNIDTADGGVAIVACRGTITVDSGSGSVNVVDSSGSLAADTGGGSVSVRGFKGPVHVDTGSGNVELREISGRNVYVDTGKGEIEAVLPGSSPGRWQLESGSGAIILQVPENISARFAFMGSNLDLDDLALEDYSLSQDRVSGSLNDGRGNVAVSSSSGNITARKIPAAVTFSSEPHSYQRQEDRERDEESLKILTMLEQGVISTAEAEKLLDALRGEADVDE